MPFLVTKGEFVPQAGHPDGDSIRFRPDNPDALFFLPRKKRPPKVNSQNGTIQLRFEGIDTMESRAATPFSSDATTSNLELCGVAGGDGTARGYLLSSQIDSGGRPICFAFAGDTDDDDASSIFLEADRMRLSVNFRQLERGHAYPLFYDTLYADLRIPMADEIVRARASGFNIWSADATQSGASYAGPRSLSTMPPVFPKLWRRLDTYSRDRDITDPNNLAEFKDFLEDRNERVFIISESKSTGLDNVVATSGDTVSMAVAPEDLIIVSK